MTKPESHWLRLLPVNPDIDGAILDLARELEATNKAIELLRRRRSQLEARAADLATPRFPLGTVLDAISAAERAREENEG